MGKSLRNCCVGICTTFTFAGEQLAFLSNPQSWKRRKEARFEMNAKRAFLARIQINNKIKHLKTVMKNNRTMLCTMWLR